MAGATYTVPGDAVYTDPGTGSRYGFHTGDVISLATAVRLSMPDASEPALPSPFDAREEARIAALIAAPKTIHNWFPDGAVSNDALIDDGTQDFDTHLWQPEGYPYPALAFLAAHTDEGSGTPWPDAVSAVLPGNHFGEGIQATDWENHYGGAAPARLIRVGVTMWADAYPTRVMFKASADNFTTYQPFAVIDLETAPLRYVIEARSSAEGAFGFIVFSTNLGLADDAVAPATTIYAAELMVTEGDPSMFADGDSAGWSWRGAAHASPSSGPQP